MDASILDTIGSPLVEIGGPTGVTIAAKMEFFNPGGSAKDRPALGMIQAAEDEGNLQPGDRIVEPTSGNTGIGLALVCATKGYDLTLVMPASKSIERRRLIRAYGADIELVDGDISDARSRADEIEADGAIQLGQFENPANPSAHYRTTGEELVEQIGDRSVDVFVAGVGTGGTLSGVGRRLREEFPDVEIVAVEPARNAVLSTGVAGEDEFQGMGPGFVSDNLDRDLIDSIETVRIEDAEQECQRLASEEGILVGQSSGAVSLVARDRAQRFAPDTEGEFDPGRPERRIVGSPAANGGVDTTTEPLIVTVFWDSGERYLSAGLFDTE